MKRLAFELGDMGLIMNINVTLNGYIQKWIQIVCQEPWNNEKINITGVDAIHAGIELEATYKPFALVLI